MVVSDRSRNHCLVFAHRGASTEAFENTRSAFDKALACDIDGIETDVQMTRDGVPVLWHDWTLARAGHPGVRIGDLDERQLPSLDRCGVVPPVAAGEGLMTLQRFVEAYHKRCRLLLELKIERWEEAPRHHAALVRACCAIADSYDAPSHSAAILFNSFNPDSLVQARRHASSRPLILNLERVEGVRAVDHLLSEYPFLAGLCLPIDGLSGEVVAALRARRKQVAVYTCNSEAEIDTALALGVDILITDRPCKALALRSGRPPAVR